MSKDHDSWTVLKKKIDSFEQRVLFQEREIWWCSSGLNVGHEQDGKGVSFRRPVLIIKKFNTSVCWAIALTTSPKENPYQLHIMFSGRISQVILSQFKLIDEKRLIKKIAKLSELQFSEIKKALAELLLKQEPFV